jgi:serine acetyltransferase
VLPEINIGAWATIAAGTVVTRDVPTGATVMGNPGRIVLTLELKLKMGWFAALPADVRHELARQTRPEVAVAQRA